MRKFRIITYNPTFNVYYLQEKRWYGGWSTVQQMNYSLMDDWEEDRRFDTIEQAEEFAKELVKPKQEKVLVVVKELQFNPAHMCRCGRN